VQVADFQLISHAFSFPKELSGFVQGGSLTANRSQ